MCEGFARYFRDAADALSKYISLKQILNMGESGVTARPFKGKKRKMVSLTSYQIQPRFQNAKNVTHVSVVTTVSLGLNSLPPLFLTVPEAAFKDAESRQLQDEFHPFRTPRGRATIPVMAPSVQHIIAPYIEFLRTRFNNQDLKIYLIMDNHSIHSRPGIFPPYGEYVVVPIWFPPHSTHCLQPKNLQVFSSFKSHWANLPMVPTNWHGTITTINNKRSTASRNRQQSLSHGSFCTVYRCSRRIHFTHEC
jgi:hypothetical protein